MTEATVMLRRVESSKPWADDMNRLTDTLLGNQGGQIKLWGDSGDALDYFTGAVDTSNNYSLDISSAAGQHQRWRDSTDTTDILAVTDAGATLVGTLGVTGATTLTGTLGVTGNTTLTGVLTTTGNVTLGDAAADALTVNATSTFAAPATFNGAITANGNVTLGDAAGDTLAVNATPTFNAGLTVATGVLGIPAGTAAAPSLAVGEATTGLFRQAAGFLGLTTGGAERARLSSSGLLMAVPITLPNATSLNATDTAGSGGAVRGVVSIDASNNQLFGSGGGGVAILRGGGVQLRYGASTTVLEIGSSTLGLFGTSPVSKRTVTGSRASGAALVSLLSALSAYGQITDSTSA